MDIALTDVVRVGGEIRKVLREFKDKSLAADLTFLSDRNLGIIGIACTLATIEASKPTVDNSEQLTLSL